MTVVLVTQLRRPDDLVSRIEAMAIEARHRGLGGLAYILENALSEARIYQHQLDGKHMQRLADPTAEQSFSLGD